MNDFSMDMDVTIDLTGQAGQIMTLEKTMFLLVILFNNNSTPVVVYQITLCNLTSPKLPYEILS